jgi:tRNA dimethylallyltransferase
MWERACSQHSGVASKLTPTWAKTSFACLRRRGCIADVPRVIHVLTGCTAAGKTELALRWAEARGAEIVSCDSLLFYRGMDIGTAKPSPAERARVPHHLIDIRGVTEQMDVTHYVTMARAAVADILGRGRRVLVTGGSGFYLKAFFAPIADDVDVPDELRAGVRARLEREGLAALVAELRRLNPAGLGALDEQNPRRVGRALERCLASGRTLAELQAGFAAQPAPFADYGVTLCELVREKPELEQRIGQRVAAMLLAGLVDEVRGLLAQGLEQNESAARAIGYRETIDFIRGRRPGNDLAAAIAQNTRALVKKQRTWFKTQLPAHRQADAGRVTVDELFD